MSDYRQLRVYHHSVQQLRDVASLAIRFGDLSNQLRRSAISVVSNIAEGAHRGSDAAYIQFLAIARGSNGELAAQLDICAALGNPDTTGLLVRNAMIGRELSGLIRYLRGSG